MLFLLLEFSFVIMMDFEIGSRGVAIVILVVVVLVVGVSVVGVFVRVSYKG